MLILQPLVSARARICGTSSRPFPAELNDESIELEPNLEPALATLTAFDAAVSTRTMALTSANFPGQVPR